MILDIVVWKDERSTRFTSFFKCKKTEAKITSTKKEGNRSVDSDF